MNLMNFYKRVAGLLLIALISVSGPLSAAKVNIHITTGGVLFTEEGVPSRLPKYIGNTPAPIIPGTEDLLDCHAIAQANPDYLKTTEVGAICNAVAQLQKHLKDPVELEIEVLFANLAALGAPTALAGTSAIVVFPEPSDKYDGAKAYDAFVNQLKKKNAQDDYRSPLISHLPNYKELSTILPDDPYYQNNPDYPNNKWKPNNIQVSQAQLKAIGVRPNIDISYPPDEAVNYYFKHPDIDFGIFMADTEAAGVPVVWDLDMSDGVGNIGPLSRAVYNSIDFTNPATWPPGFNVQNPSINDFQGVFMHELTHGLGFLSNIGDDSSFGGVTLPAPVDVEKMFQGVTFLDLFRFRNSDVASMKNVNDFRKAPRFWALEDIAFPFCNQDLGNAVVTLDYGKEGFYTAPLANGRYINPNTGGVVIGKGDGRQASHYRSPFNKIPLSAQSQCNSSSYTSAKGLFFYEDPPGRIMRPASGPQNPNFLTNDDLKALDVLGWNIDYSGSQSTVLDPYEPYDLNSALMSQSAFESANGVKLKKSHKLIVE